MGAGSIEENRSGKDNALNRTAERSSAYKKHSSSNSDSSHHSHGTHNSHSSHSSHHHSSGTQERKKYRRSGKSKSRTTNISAEYEKQKKIKWWWRSVFIALICGGLIWLVIMIFTTGQGGGGWNLSWKPSGTDNTQLQTELESLKTENMNLKYELEKYKEEYGELDAQQDETEDSKEETGASKKPSASSKASKK